MYSLEPSCRDIFVEGASDKAILESSLRKVVGHRYKVYEVGSIEVPSSLLVKHQLTEGNKQRVMALARELSSDSSQSCYFCMVDRDLDHWFGELELTRGLVWTKYCSIESHFITEEKIKEILVVLANSKIHSWRDFYLSFLKTLRSLYSMRLALRELNWYASFLPIKKCTKRESDIIVFDLESYSTRLLNECRMTHLKHIFMQSIIKWDCLADNQDSRNFIHGHDFLNLLGWAIDNYGGVRGFANVQVLERQLIVLAHDMSEILEVLYNAQSETYAIS